MTPLQRQIAIIGIIAAIRYLHKNNIMLIKLNPENILFDENFNTKIPYTDILAKDGSIYNKIPYSPGRPWCYMSPECFSGYDDVLLNKDADIYSLAMIIYSLIADSFPFKEKNDRLRSRSDFSLKEHIHSEDLRPHFTEEFTEPIRSLLEKCWDSYPAMRPEINEIFDIFTSSTEYYINGLTESDLIEIDKYIQVLKSFEESEITPLDISYSVLTEANYMNDDQKALSKEEVKLQVKTSEKVVNDEQKALAYVDLTLDQIFTCINNNDFKVYKKEIVMHSLIKLANDKIMRNKISIHNLFKFVNDLVVENNEDAIQFLKIRFGDYIVSPDVKILTEKICDKMIKSVNIPPTVTTIGKSSFAGFVNLYFVNIPNSVVEIEEKAFCDCHSLFLVILPESVKIIGRAAFYNCSKLMLIQIPSKVTEIQQETFKNDSSLSEVILGNNLKYIEKQSFYGCEALVSIRIPKSVALIQDEAFYGCKGLKKIIFEGDKPKIGKKAIPFRVIKQKE